MGGHHQGEKLHMCPNCNIPVQWLGVANIIDPFWKRMPQFFLYPFSFRPLLLMLGLSLIASLLTRPGIIGLLTTIAVWGVAFKYAYAILQSTARGDLTTPKLDSRTLSENFGPVVKQVGIYVAIFFVAGIVFAKLGAAGGAVYLILATLFLPAMIILLVTTGSLIQAVNPMMFVTLALRIGWGYLLMYFFYSILGGAPALLGRHVIQFLPPLLQVFLFTLIKIYYTFISYHLMGYVILQYHQDIGYEVDVEDFKDEETEKDQAMAAADDPESRMLKRINQLIKEGNFEGAREVIENETGGQGIAGPLLSERYFTLLKMTGAKNRLMVHGRNHLDLLVHGNKKTEAMDVYVECLSRDPGFSPAAGALFKLGGWFNETGKSREAIGAFSKLTQAYPQDPLVPKSYFRAAQIFNDRLMNPEKAKKILNGLVKKYPDHDIIPFVQRYLLQMG
jgi:TolA-binding protein